MPSVRFSLNGRPVELAAAEDRSLIRALRTDLAPTGTNTDVEKGFAVPAPFC